MVIIGPNINNIKSFITQIKSYFNIKELGLIKDYLGIDIDLKPNKYIKLSQTTYINKVLAKFNMKDAEPMDSKVKLEPNPN